jgi:glycosyltransferase involved in cell wall biosynthesis
VTSSRVEAAGLAQPGGGRVLIDASMARGGGGFTYLVNLVPRLAMAPDMRFLVLLRDAKLVASLRAPVNVEIEELPERSLPGRLDFLLRGAPALARRWGAGLYFSVAEYTPRTLACPMIACFRNPNVFTSLDQGWGAQQRLRLSILRGLARASARRCARVLFVSHDSAAWIGQAMGVPPERRAVVHHGIDLENFRARREARAARPCGILSVSSIYRYKNFVRLIEAYGRLASRLPQTSLPELNIVGDDQDAPYSKQMRRAIADSGPLASRIHLQGAVPYAEVPAWYAGADLFVFPSYLETFGHPLLEAMASRLPLVAADIPVFREIAGEAAIYADPFDVEALAAALGRGLEAGPAREQRIATGCERVERFSWEATSRKLLAVFAQVLAEARDTGG